MVLRQKISTDDGDVEPDQRGKHKNHPVVSDAIKDMVS